MRHRRASTLLACFLAAAPAAAQWNRVEISPYGGYRWGGELEAEDNALFRQDVEVDSSATFGLRLAIGVHPNVQVELLAARQESELGLDRQLFGEDRGLLDVTINYYHLGGLFQWGGGQAQPFVTVSGGIGRIAPDLPGVAAEERLSASFGGGVKVFVNRHVGFRFEGRFFWTDTNDDDDFFDDDWGLDYGDDLYQGEVTVGLVLGL
ncbi:MAG TPA: outer membrane beta-barrel protein [Thermoanaerobaculia bacterium]|nr:outer membrane beta-barrel protein [Thermoanaerobaculia bacterium]